MKEKFSSKAIDDFAMYAKTLLNIDYDKNELYPLIGKCDNGKEEIIKNWAESIKKKQRI